MKLNNISSFGLNSHMRMELLRQQNALFDAQKEISTGKYADLAKTLGAFSSSVISFEGQIKSITQLKTTNSFMENRLATMQNGLGSMVEGSNHFLSELGAEISGSVQRELMAAIGGSMLETVTATLNVTYRGEFVFSGINTDAQALVDYDGSSGAAAKTAVENAFVTEFGFPVDDPGAAGISPGALKSFIDGAFSTLFDDANWQTLWTDSALQGMRAKISPRELAEVPVTAHAGGFRDIVAATVLVTQFIDGALSDDAVETLANSALEMTATAIARLGSEQSKIGVVEERIETANERMDYQKNILEKQLSEVTDVDPYEAATRLNQIIVGLEASYAATARIQSLSLMNYL